MVLNKGFESLGDFATKLEAAFVHAAVALQAAGCIPYLPCAALTGQEVGSAASRGALAHCPLSATVPLSKKNELSSLLSVSRCFGSLVLWTGLHGDEARFSFCYRHCLRFCDGGILTSADRQVSEQAGQNKTNKDDARCNKPQPRTTLTPPRSAPRPV